MLFVSGWCFVGDVLGVMLRSVWVCEWCISSRVCIVVALSVCISDEPSVCSYIGLRFVTCLFICDKGHKSK